LDTVPDFKNSLARLPEAQQRVVAIRHGLRTIPYLSEFLTDTRFPVFSDVLGKVGDESSPEDIALAVMLVGLCGLLQTTSFANDKRALSADSNLSHVLNRLHLDHTMGVSDDWIKDTAEAIRSLTRLGVGKSDPNSTIGIAQSVLSKTDVSALEAASEVTQDILSINSFDEDVELFSLPLWSSDAASNEALHIWKADKEEYLEKNPSWSFWLHWYDGLLQGKPLDWELQSRVASKLVSTKLHSVTEAANLIREAHYAFVSEKTAVSATPVFDEEQGLFHLEDRSFLHDSVVEFVVNRTLDALENAIHLSSDNTFNASAFEARVLSKALSKISINPSDLALTLVEARHSLSGKMVSGEYPQDSPIIALSNQLFIGKEELCDYDEIVRRRCERLENLMEPLPFSEGATLLLEELPAQTKEIVDQELQEKIKEAVEAVRNSDGPQKDEAAKLTHWVTSMQIEIGKAIRKGDNSLAYKAAKIADFMTKTAQKLIDLWPF